MESMRNKDMIKKAIKAAVRPFTEPFRPGNVVMFHLGRSGSTVLAELLKQHSRIFWGSELYNRIFLQWERKNDGKEVVEELTEDPVLYLQNDMKRAYHRYYGFEIKPFHFKLIGHTPGSYLNVLEQNKFEHFIILNRKNRMRKIISSTIAHSDKSRYHIKSNEKSSIKKIHIDVNHVQIDFDNKPLIDYLTDYDEQMALLDQLLEGKKVLHLTYEDHIQENPRIAYEKSCEFLGLKPQPVEIRLSRTNPFPVREMIENIEEVERVLKGTPYMWMLEE